MNFKNNRLLVHLSAFSFAIIGILILFQNFAPHYVDNEEVVGTQVAPGGGGRMPGIYPSPNDPNLLFVATDMGTIFKSVDGGDNFRQIDGIIGLNFLNDGEEHYSHPWAENTDGKIFAGTNNGLYSSENKGDSWTKVGGFSKGPKYIVTSSACPDLVVGGFMGNGQAFISVSSNKGITWSEVVGGIDDQLRGVVINDCSLGAIDLLVGFRKQGVKRYKIQGQVTTQQAFPSSPFYLNPVIKLREIKGIKLANQNNVLTYAIFEKFSPENNKFEKSFLFKFHQVNNGWVYVSEKLSPEYFGSIALDQYNANYLALGYSGRYDPYASFAPAPDVSSNASGVWESFNAGTSLTDVFFPHSSQSSFNTTRTFNSANGWIWHQKPDIVVSESWQVVDPISGATRVKRCVYLSQSGAFKRCTGDPIWKSLAYAPITENGESAGRGIPVLAVWDYLVVKSADGKNSQYMSSTDFAFFQSNNMGQRWRLRSTGMNNVYQIKIEDPNVNQEQLSGWAVGGFRHDLPTNWSDIGVSDPNQDKGMIVYTGNNFDSYTTRRILGGVVTSMIQEDDVIYVSIFKSGIYRFSKESFLNTDPNHIFSLTNVSEGLNFDSRNNMNIHRLEKNSKGELFALSTARPRLSDNLTRALGNIFVKDEVVTNGITTSSWRNLIPRESGYYSPNYTKESEKVIPYPVSIAFVGDSEIFAASQSVPKDDPNSVPKYLASGGLWHGSIVRESGRISTVTWSRITDVGVNFVTIHPLKTNIVYLSVRDREQPEKEQNYGLYEYNRSDKTVCRVKNFIGRAPMAIRFFNSNLYLTTIGNGVIKMPLSKIQIDLESCRSSLDADSI